MRVGSTEFTASDIVPVLQILEQQVRGDINGFTSSNQFLDVDGDGTNEEVRFQEEFIQISGEFYQIFESPFAGEEGEFITFTDELGNNSLIQLQGEFGNEVFTVDNSIINTQGRFIQGTVSEFGSSIGEDFFQIEGDFLEIGREFVEVDGEIVEVGGEIVEIQGDLGEEFIEFRGENIQLDDNGAFPFDFFSVRTNTINNIEVGGELILDTEEEQISVPGDLETIVNLISSSTSFRISGNSLDDPDKIIGNESNPSFDAVPILIEAEDLNLDTYLVENLDIGGQAISLLDATGSVGTATLNVEDFSISSGTYDLTLGVFDENDGQAQLEVLVNGDVIGEPVILNQNTDSRLPVEATRREIVIEDIDIEFDDTITIRGTANNTEWARVDFLNFSLSNSDDDSIAELSVDESTSV